MQQLLEKLANREEENEQVFYKEIYLLRNDLYYKFYEHRKERWFVDISYKPKRRPSGDTYSIRKIGKTKLLVILIDAMGKGLTASITSLLSSAYINDYIDRTKENFDLHTCIRSYREYIAKLIFEEELVSCSFVLFDFESRQIRSALFGMPPILLCHEENDVIKLKSNNPPLTRFTARIDIQTRSFEEIRKILLYTDGLNETVTEDGRMYRHHLDRDFREAPNSKLFLEKVLERTGDFDDDMTFVFLEREKQDLCQIESFCVSSKRSEIDDAMTKMDALLSKEELDTKNRAYMMQAFSELLMNAYEHGNLGIDHKIKRNLLEEGKFDAFIEEKERKNGEKKIDILLRIADRSHLKTFEIEIGDEGEGFDTALMRDRIIKKKQFNGRGLLMVSKLTDGYYYNAEGNRVIIKKFIYKE